MAFSRIQYSDLRPYLWHLTHRQNLELIKQSSRLLSAESLGGGSIEPRFVRHLSGISPVLREQDLLHKNCVQLEPGCSWSDLLHELNRRGFFWSGWHDRPVRQGRSAIGRYCETDILIRVPFLDVAPESTPYFTRCNAGATRMQHGKRILRGPGTFKSASDCG